MRERLFSLDEALNILPRVRLLLEELIERKRDLAEKTARFDESLARTTGNGHLQDDLARARGETERLAMEMQKALDELDGLGVQLKDIDQGLVDFPSRRDGRVVYLCWRLGEETIAWWHDVDTGFAGRQPL